MVPNIEKDCILLLEKVFSIKNIILLGSNKKTAQLSMYPLHASGEGSQKMRKSCGRLPCPPSPALTLRLNPKP